MGRDGIEVRFISRMEIAFLRRSISLDIDEVASITKTRSTGMSLARRSESGTRISISRGPFLSNRNVVSFRPEMLIEAKSEVGFHRLG